MQNPERKKSKEATENKVCKFVQMCSVQPAPNSTTWDCHAECALSDTATTTTLNFPEITGLLHFQGRKGVQARNQPGKLLSLLSACPPWPLWMACRPHSCSSHCCCFHGPVRNHKGQLQRFIPHRHTQFNHCSHSSCPCTQEIHTLRMTDFWRALSSGTVCSIFFFLPRIRLEMAGKF